MGEFLKATLALEDGSIFGGYSFGYPASSSGEVVFNTGMAGYPETLTDPSYFGQIIVFTYPHIGNYGIPIHEKDRSGLERNFESHSIHAKGVIIQNYEKHYSHINAEKSLGAWLNEEKVPGIFGIDTRALVKKIREKGTIPGKIIIGGEKEFEENTSAASNLCPAEHVSIKEPQSIGSGKRNIGFIDCGAKHSLIRAFLREDTCIIRLPWDYNLDKAEFDGLVVSNGPGNPEIYSRTIENLKIFIGGKKPVFGICLGNQLIALASGARTYKMRYGHRSQNQPCIDKLSKKAYITSQNHGYCVDAKSLGNNLSEWFANLNDLSCEGIISKDGLVRGVQFHPEGCPGPKDTAFLFDDFIELVRKKAKKA